MGKGFFEGLINGNGRFKTGSQRKAFQHAHAKDVLADAGRSYAAEIAGDIAPYPISALREWEKPQVSATETSGTLSVSLGHPVSHGLSESPGFYKYWQRNGTAVVSVEALLKELAAGETRAYFLVRGWRKGEKTKSSRFKYHGETAGAVEQDTLLQYVNDALAVVRTGLTSGVQTYGRRTGSASTKYSGKGYRKGPVRVVQHTRGRPRRIY